MEESMGKTLTKKKENKTILISLVVFFIGVFTLSQSYQVAKLDLNLVSQRYLLFWLGMTIGYIAIILLIYNIQKLTKIKILLTLGMLTIISYAPKMFLGVAEPVYFDEKIHVAHAQNIIDAGSFFIVNSMNPPISAYPITQSLLIFVSSITRLSLYTSGVLILLICHFFTLFLIYKISRVLKLPVSASIFASLIYSIAPSFWFNGSQVSYQPIAFPIALGALFFLLKYFNENIKNKQKLYLSLYVVLTLLTTFTHHATAIILGLFLILGGVICIFIKDKKYQKLMPFGFLTVIVAAFWYIVNNPTQVDYLIPSQAINALLIGSDGESTSRVAFSGSILPIYEQIAGYVGPVIIFIVAVSGLILGWNSIKPVFMKYLLGFILVSYPISFPFTLISETNVLAHRIWPYQYIAVSILAGAGLVLGYSGILKMSKQVMEKKKILFATNPEGGYQFIKDGKNFIFTLLVIVIVAMGNASLDGDDSLRFAVQGSESKTVNSDTKMLGAWIKENFGKSSRIAGDTDTINDMHLYGEAWVVKEVPLWELTFKESNNFNDALGLMKLKNVEFFIVNTDILNKRPQRGYYYSTYEPNAYKTPPSLVLDKLNLTSGLTKIKTQGKYVVYKINPSNIIVTPEDYDRLEQEISDKTK
jgi:hypothetical protein